jgi:hypothetical protein
VLPVMPLASGDARKTATLPTSAASSFCVRGAFTETYSTILSMIPMALAARDCQRPGGDGVDPNAELATRLERERSRVALECCLWPTTFHHRKPGTTRSLARYVRRQE